MKTINNFETNTVKVPAIPPPGNLDEAITNKVSVQFGCGLWAPATWKNYDVSPALRLQKIPILGNLIPKGPFGDWPKNVKYGNIITGLPLPDGSVDHLYCSHVLEHLALEDFRTALRNSYQLLKPGGVFRFVLPDLEGLVKAYQNNNSTDASMEFMEESYLGRHQRAKGFKGFVREWLGNSKHLWMWDFKSMKKELEAVGFKSVRRAYYHDSKHPEFKEVEELRRWEKQLGINCFK